jgi:hypothetical protein
MGKKSGSGMDILDHFSESLETVFRAKVTRPTSGAGSGIHNLIDPESGMEKIRIQDPG